MKIEEMKELIQAVSDSEVDEFKYSDEKMLCPHHEK